MWQKHNSLDYASAAPEALRPSSPDPVFSVSPHFKIVRSKPRHALPNSSLHCTQLQTTAFTTSSIDSSPTTTAFTTTYGAVIKPAAQFIRTILTCRTPAIFHLSLPHQSPRRGTSRGGCHGPPQDTASHRCAAPRAQTSGGLACWEV